MVLSLCPVTAMAEGNMTYVLSYNDNGADSGNAPEQEYIDNNVCSITRGEQTTEYPSVAEALEAEYSESAEAPTVITMIADDAENFEIPEGRFVTLDLNGYVLTSTELEQTSTPIITNNGTLTLRDSDDEAATHTTHFFEVNEDNRWILTENTGNAKDISALSARPDVGDVISVSGGVITGSEYSTGALINYGYLTVNGGNFIGNAEPVNVTAGSNGMMTGGLISGNGSYVSVGGNLTMSGGKISFNTNPSYFGGGGVNISGTFTMSGNAEISFNEAEYGGGIYASAGEVLIVGNAKVINNIANEDGGGISAEENSTVTIQKDERGNEPLISGNETEGRGGGIHLAESAGYAYGGSITGNHADGEGGGVFVDVSSNFTVGEAKVTGNTSDTNGGGISVSDEKGGCFIEGTEITMADGTVKNIEDVQNGELIRTFDHETGAVSFEKVCHKFSGEGTRAAFTLSFTDDIELSIVGSHGLLEKESGKYVLIDSDNALSFVGHHFYNADMDCWEELLGVSCSGEQYSFYALYSGHHINAVANHMLSVTDDALFRVNVFDFDDDMKIDAEKKQQDIETYGLTAYEDFSDYTDEEEFYRFNNQYDHIAVCKGLTTAEEIIRLALNEMSAAEVQENTAKEIVTCRLTMPVMYSANDAILGESKSAPLTVCTGATITGNTVEDKPNNIYLAEDHYILIDGDVPEKISVGITTSNEPTDSAPVKITCNGTKDEVKYFSSDNRQYAVKINNNATETDTSDDYFELVIKPAHTHDMGTADTSDDITFEKEITAEAELKDLFANGGSGYLGSDIVLSETAKVAQFKEVSLCLNDHTVTLADEVSGSIIFADNHSTLLITDCGTTVRFFTDTDRDGAFETVHNSSFNVTGKTLGKDYIKTVGGVITGGKATYGGAIYADSYTNLTLDGINIVGSIAESNGGAVNSAYELTVKDCVIAGNLSTGNGGAIACAELSSVTGSKLSYNTAHKEGGAIYSMDSSATSITGTELIGNRVINESETESAAAGGAMSICHKNATITDCTINDNYVYSKYGIAQFAALAASTLTIKNTTVSDNTAEGKNAESIIQAGPVSMEDCTVSGNKLIGESSAKILIYLANGDSVIKSSAIKNNTAACTGKAVATAGIEADNVKVSTLTLEGDPVFSGNTFCDIYSINTLDMSKLGSVKDADGQTAKLAYYYKGKITQVFDMTLSTVVEKDLSSYLTAVNNEAYIVNKTAEGGSQVHMLSRILEQPAKANGNTFKLYTEDLKATDVTYQWYKLNGSYLTEEDNVITLVNGTWDGSAINGEYMGPKGGTMVKLTTEEEYLYMYDPDGVYYDIMAGKAEAVTGHSGVYKVTPDNKQITVKASKLLFSKTLVTESAVDGYTSSSLDADKTGQYRCIAKVKGTDIISNYVTVDHIHAWSYTLSADGRTVTAKCSDDCSYTGKDTTLTISASGTSYDGNTHGASFGEAKTLCGGTLPAISYQAKNADSTYGAASSDAPVNAGTYKASFTVGTGTAARTASVEYTISPKALSAAGFTVTTDPGSMVYTGKELKPAVTVKDGEKTLTEGTDYTVSYTGNVNAGSATVTVTGIGNYQNSTGGSFTVTKVNDNRITGSLSCADITNGRTPAPTGTTAAYGTVKYVYSADGNSWGTWDEVNSGVGIYHVKAVAAGNDNYNGAESDAVSFEVEAADEPDEPTNTLAAFLAKILAFYTAFISFFSKLGWAICT